MKSRIESQVERIIDEGSGRRRSVIVQMDSRREGFDALIEGACEAVRERALVASARDLLPAPASAHQRGKGGKLSAAQRRKLRSAAASFTSQVALATASSAPRRPGKRSLVAEGRRAVRPLRSSAVVQKALSSPPKGVRAAKELWSSGSLALEVTPDELRKLTREVEGIADVFENRRREVPPVVEVESVPANVADNKTSAWGLQAIGALAAWGPAGSCSRTAGGPTLRSSLAWSGPSTRASTSSACPSAD